jgi:UDP-N-acetylmuramyl pentapeptide phosphotransferase/UDP-N-acetylglucosamine-1-phosphate transferase
MTATTVLLVALGAALVCASSIAALMPLFARYALARPNARSSHAVPTPQGGGVAVLTGIAVALAGAIAAGSLPASQELVVLGLATLLLALVGATDDIRPLPVMPRLVLQILAVAAVVCAPGDDVRLLPGLPLAVERGLEIFAGVWFVNLVNFMDGIDWMSVAETVPIAGAIALMALAGLLPAAVGIVAAALLGGMLGFAPFNRPVARLFAGDVGSLPIGLLVAWLLYSVADTGALSAALLLPLYYCADASITLIRRLMRGEPLWQAHRTHFYQRAIANGYSALAVAREVFALNLGLAALAAATFLWRTLEAQIALLLIGAAAVALVLYRFARAPAGKVATPQSDTR